MNDHLLETVKNIITRGKEEAAYPINSLERIALKASRLGDDEKAGNIDAFLAAVSPELNFFRAVSEKRIAEGRLPAAISAVRNYLTQKPQHIRDLHPNRPFVLVEGYSVATSIDAKQLTGAFFLVSASSFTAYPLLGPDTRNYLFTQAQDSTDIADGAPEFELRIMDESTFDKQISGSNWESTTLYDYHHPQSRGSIKEVFAHAVTDMTRFSLGYNAPEDMAKKWIEALEAKDKQPSLTHVSPVNDLRIAR